MAAAVAVAVAAPTESAPMPVCLSVCLPVLSADVPLLWHTRRHRDTDTDDDDATRDGQNEVNRQICTTARVPNPLNRILTML